MDDGFDLWKPIEQRLIRIKKKKKKRSVRRSRSDLREYLINIHSAFITLAN